LFARQVKKYENFLHFPPRAQTLASALKIFTSDNFFFKFSLQLSARKALESGEFFVFARQVKKMKTFFIFSPRAQTLRSSA
jgi:hypothetical protein